MVPARLVEHFEWLNSYFSQEHVVKPETKKSLPLALMQSLKQPFFAAIMPRLFLIVFRYSQPILIRETIRYAAASFAYAETNNRSWLVLSAVAIYTGLAVRT